MVYTNDHHQEFPLKIFYQQNPHAISIECLIWHVDFVGKRVSRETLGDGR